MGKGILQGPRYVKVYRTSKTILHFIVKIGKEEWKKYLKSKSAEFCFSLKLRPSCGEALYACLHSTNDG